MLYLKLGAVFVVACMVQWGLIRILSGKLAFQFIYELSPQSHQKKSKTPTLGGVGIMIALGVGLALFWTVFKDHPVLLWVSVLMLGFACLGFVDDMLSLKRSKNAGLKAWQKFGLQVLLAFVCMWGYGAYISPLTVGVAVFYGFVIVGTSNACNLTDGLDGLLAGCSVITLLGFIVGFMADFFIAAQLFCVCLGMALLGFLVFNRNPARIFMGDTGSLALGACFAGLAIVYGNVWVLLPLGAVYILETVSVMIQVIYFKFTKRRVFLMAPLHHHFELIGVSERKVVWLFWVMAALFVGGFFLSL